MQIRELHFYLLTPWTLFYIPSKFERWALIFGLYNRKPNQKCPRSLSGQLHTVVIMISTKKRHHYSTLTRSDLGRWHLTHFMSDILLQHTLVFKTVYSRKNPGPFFKNGFHWHGKQKSKFIVMRRSDGKIAATVETDAFFTAHQVWYSILVSFLHFKSLTWWMSQSGNVYIVKRTSLSSDQLVDHQLTPLTVISGD